MRNGILGKSQNAVFIDVDIPIALVLETKFIPIKMKLMEV